MRTLLYLGLHPPKLEDVRVIHCPLIEIVPRPKESSDIAKALKELSKVTHFIVTSQSAAAALLKLGPDRSKSYLSVGKATTKALHSVEHILTAKEECQEGIIKLIESLENGPHFFFWGHSSRSRSTLHDYLVAKSHPYVACILYETRLKAPQFEIDLDEIDEVYFSSSSTVEAFFHYFGAPPNRLELYCQGSETKKTLHCHLSGSEGPTWKD